MINIVVCLIVFLVVVSLWGFYAAIYPMRIISKNTPKDFNIPYEAVSFRTEDGILIRGWFIPAETTSKKTIILLHGYPADKGDIFPSRIFLHANYNLLFLDFRYLGESEGKYSTLGKGEVLDLKAAVQFLKARGINEVGVWGLSMGGAVALMGASEISTIKAVVAEAAFARLDWLVADYYRIPLLRYPLASLTRFWGWLFLGYRVSDVVPMKAAATLKIPVLLIASKQDEVISFKHALALQKAMSANPKLEVIFVDDGSHGQSIHDMDRIIKKFFDTNL